jgi:hypothetical protein
MPFVYMVAKFIHNLINTNHQNQKFYGKTPLCPCCQQTDETRANVFTCGAQRSTDSQIKALKELQNDLTPINTPVKVIDVITHSMTMWECFQTNLQLQVHALTVGSPHLLTAAFTDQFHSIDKIC